MNIRKKSWSIERERKRNKWHIIERERKIERVTLRKRRRPQGIEFTHEIYFKTRKWGIKKRIETMYDNSKEEEGSICVVFNLV